MKNVQKTLKKLGIKPVEGQVFLNSENIVKALVEAGEVQDKKVLEVGPGTGLITEKLLDKSSKVYAVEKDTTLANHLKKEFDSDKLEVINKDINKLDFPEVDRCVANPPFGISSNLLKKLGEKQIQSSLILQKELAEKIIADPGDPKYNEFSVIINYYFVPVKLQDISKRKFYPMPEVETSIVKLYPNKQRHGIKNEEEFFKVVKALFTHDKKKVRNAFEDGRHILEISKNKAKEIKDDIPHSEKRVNQLEIIDFKEIVDEYQKLLNKA
ncbi:MAG: 16S rRNA (adenine(1518)-N(6)/adenine(1519)-N(6))-dimethyltransferase RsmA [Candidatus Nanohaloarchaea archaeon]